MNKGYDPFLTIALVYISASKATVSQGLGHPSFVLMSEAWVA